MTSPEGSSFMAARFNGGSNGLPRDTRAAAGLGQSTRTVAQTSLIKKIEEVAVFDGEGASHAVGSGEAEALDVIVDDEEPGVRVGQQPEAHVRRPEVGHGRLY